MIINIDDGLVRKIVSAFNVGQKCSTDQIQGALRTGAEWALRDVGCKCARKPRDKGYVGHVPGCPIRRIKGVRDGVILISEYWVDEPDHADALHHAGEHPGYSTTDRADSTTDQQEIKTLRRIIKHAFPPPPQPLPPQPRVTS